MNWTSIETHAAAFLVGALTGAAGTYLADRFTDQRRRQEHAREAKRHLVSVANQMPELIDEIRADVTNPEFASIREFIVMPSTGAVFNSGGRKFLAYHEDVHQDLLDKVAILENHGWVTDVTSTNVPKYRMSEEFVRLLREL